MRPSKEGRFLLSYVNKIQTKLNLFLFCTVNSNISIFEKGYNTMSDWFERINGHYGSNTVWDTQKAGGANESSGAQQSPRVVGAGNSDDDYVETDFEDDSVNNLGSEYHTYDELQTMYDSKQEEVTSAEGEVNKWQDNSQNGIADAEAAYDEAVQNDKEISDELKKDQAENSKAITAKENEISEKESKITTLEGDISDCELNIEHIDAQKSKIQVLLDSLPAVKTSQTKEEWQQIEEQKSDYETQIENADRELYLEKTKKERFEGELETAKSEKETLDGELDKLNEVKDGIDEKIRESCSQETKDLQKALNDLKVEVEQNKTTAQTSLDSRRSELQEIANYMNNHASLKTDDISTDPVPNAASEAGSMLNGQKEMSFDDFNTLYGDEFYETVGDYYLHDGEWCAKNIIAGVLQTGPETIMR